MYQEVQKSWQAAFGLEEPLLSFDKLSGGQTNQTFLCTSSTGRYVLRYYMRDAKLASIEASLLRKLEHFLEVPVPLYIDAFAQPVPFAIFQYIEGSPLQKKKGVHLEGLLGKTLAVIHSFSFDQAGLFGSEGEIATTFPEGSSPYLEYLREVFHEQTIAWKRLGKPLSIKLQEFVEEHHEQFPCIQKSSCLVHGDFKPCNLLITKKPSIAVLDWEFAHAGCAMFDWAVFYRFRDSFPLDFDQMRQAYLEHGGMLPEDWHWQALVLDLVNLIDLLNRVDTNSSLLPFYVERIKKTICA